jgi:hypothetical protein
MSKNTKSFGSAPGYSLALVLAAGLFAGGCSRDNGLPKELTRHLADRGVQITPIRAQAPLSSRGGYIVAAYNAQTVTNIVATFKLEKIESDNRQWRWAIDKAGGAVNPKELWGVAGRPAQFKLKSGAQFEYFYLLITTDGLMYLLAEYAYG